MPSGGLFNIFGMGSQQGGDQSYLRDVHGGVGGTGALADQARRSQALIGFNGAANAAQGRAMGAAMTMGGGGNAALASRQGTNAAATAAGQIMGQRARAESSMAQGQQEAARVERERQKAASGQMMGNLLGGAASIAGMVVPGMGAAAGPAQALGQSLGGGGNLGAAIGAIGQPGGGGGQLGPLGGLAQQGAPPTAIPRIATGPAQPMPASAAIQAGPPQYAYAPPSGGVIGPQQPPPPPRGIAPALHGMGGAPTTLGMVDGGMAAYDEEMRRRQMMLGGGMR